MAIIQMSYFSNALMRTVPITVVLPADKTDFSGKWISKPPYKTLYLLHGIFGDNTDWINGTRVARWAQEHDLAVVMPAGENHFYLNHPGGGENYGDMIGQELMDITRRIFPLSDKREDTYIGGLSMGGYGALYSGLCHPETFGGIAALSSAMPVDQMRYFEEIPGNILTSKAFMEACFGCELEALKDSMANHHLLAKDTVSKDVPLPRIFMACGTEDSLFPLDKAFAEELESLGYDVVWKEEKGGHEWDFWDTMIYQVINWISPEPGTSGTSSGNVGI